MGTVSSSEVQTPGRVRTLTEADAPGHPPSAGLTGVELPSEPVVVIEPTRAWVGLNLKDIWNHRELLYFLAWRDMKVRYKQTALGVLWVLLQPLLNYFGIGSEMLDYVVDRSTVKQGMFTPGTHLPIMSPECLLEDQPDYVLLLTWNFAAEILKQQAEYLSKGGHFIIPIPELRIVANDSQPITVEAQA